jgi:hypothetical protein
MPESAGLVPPNTLHDVPSLLSRLSRENHAFSLGRYKPLALSDTNKHIDTDQEIAMPETGDFLLHILAKVDYNPRAVVWV